MCKFPVDCFSWNVRIGEIIPSVLPDLVRSYDARRRFRFRLLCLAFDNAVETHDVRDQKVKDDGATASIPRDPTILAGLLGILALNLVCTPYTIKYHLRYLEIWEADRYVKNHV